MSKMKVVLASPRGFCAGVLRAIHVVEKALELYGPPIYVKHEIVHNKYVVEDFKARGVIFIDDVNNIPEGAITIFSAHGVSESVENTAKSLNLNTIDATCPLVKKVHNEAKHYEKKGKRIILIGHRGHIEVEGTSGRVKQKVDLVQNVNDVEKLDISPETPLAYVTQTTLSVDDTKIIIAALKKKFPNIHGPDVKDICYATQNRQDAVRQLSKKADLILVVGSQNSSNSNRLKDLAEECGAQSYLIDDANDLKQEWVVGKGVIGITAGASAPEMLVTQIIDKLRNFGEVECSTLEGVEENIYFKLPKELSNPSAA